MRMRVADILSAINELFNGKIFEEFKFSYGKTELFKLLKGKLYALLKAKSPPLSHQNF